MAINPASGGFFDEEEECTVKRLSAFMAILVFCGIVALTATMHTTPADTCANVHIMDVHGGAVTSTVVQSQNSTTVAAAPPPSSTTPWEGYDHNVGLAYVKLCRKKGKGCKGSLETTLQDLPTGNHLRAKLKRKGNQWPDVTVEGYCSTDKVFDEGDIFLGREKKKLSKEKYRDKTKESVYIENVNLKKCVTQLGATYYLYAVVRYAGGINVSTESDSDEHVRITVVPEEKPPTVVSQPVQTAPPAVQEEEVLPTPATEQSASVTAPESEEESPTPQAAFVESTWTSTPIADLYYTDPVQWNMHSNGVLHAQDGAIGDISFTRTEEVFEVMLSVTVHPLSILHTRGTDFPIPEDEVPVAVCIGIDGYMTAPATIGDVVQSPYCDLLPKDPGNSAVSALIQVSGAPLAQLREEFHATQGGLAVAILTRRR